MEKIAVYVNREGMAASIKEEGFVRLYAKEGTSWIIWNNISCSINFSSGLQEVKKGISELLQQLDDCRIFAATEVSGQLYYLLESYGYSSYEIEGEPEPYLESILQTENDEITKRANAAQETVAPVMEPEPTEQPGVYLINLRKALAMNPDISSKKLLKPFLMENKFEVLEIICDHVPRWFDTDLKALGWDMKITNNCENEYTVIMNKKVM